MLSTSLLQFQNQQCVLTLSQQRKCLLCCTTSTITLLLELQPLLLQQSGSLHGTTTHQALSGKAVTCRGSYSYSCSCSAARRCMPSSTPHLHHTRPINVLGQWNFTTCCLGTPQSLSVDVRPPMASCSPRHKHNIGRCGIVNHHHSHKCMYNTLLATGTYQSMRKTTDQTSPVLPTIQHHMQPHCE